MNRVLCVANQKGGVGKTTTALSVAAYMALAGHRTLVVDCDSQGNSFSVLACDQEEGYLHHGASGLETGRDDLMVARYSLRTRDEGELRALIEEQRTQYAAVIIDCPPSLAGVATKAIVASDEILIPIQAEYYALEGLGQILGLLADLRAQGHARPERLRVMLCMYDERLRLCRDVAHELRLHLGEQVMRAVIPRDVALAAAPSHRQTIIEHSPLAPGSLAYCAATKELLDG